MATILQILLPIVCIKIASSVTEEELVAMPGHMKPFGFTETKFNIPEVEGFPFTRQFFTDHVRGSMPLIMKNAASLSRAFDRWTDEYFLNTDEPADYEIIVEMKKKENRSEPAVQMSFKDFVRVYNKTDQYMVNTIPPMIAPDVILPGPLQCELMESDVLVDAVMWFSSGGTKSVVHTDSVDNINCLFRGEKRLVMVDPAKYASKVDIDRPEGAYSSVDVDKVDFTKFPGLAEVEYYHVHMTAGDCLYIPFKWIHQVESFGSNIAVNVWWDHHLALAVDLDECPDEFDPDFTMDKVHLMGFDSMTMSGEMIRDNLLDYTTHGAVDFNGALKLLVQDLDYLNDIDPGKGYQRPVRKIFELLDENEDGFVTAQEVETVTDEEWDTVIEYMGDFDETVTRLENALQNMYGDPGTLPDDALSEQDRDEL